ncbi:MAG TPA: hypothetical protein VMP67_10795 [Candidatus Limnocylindria bacterium]|nr:hypothetical protein [Candidatus Limnocylindria bacterium]
MRRFRITAAIWAVTLMLLPLALPAAAADGLGAVRDATRDFRDVAAAEAAGYAILEGTPLEECIDEPGEGAMGVHLINGDLVGDTVLDPTTPEALVYIPRADGSLRLVAVEYVVFAEAWDAANATPPQILGHEMHLISEPNRYELPAFYELHAWVWQDNPSGMFNDWNPDVSCDPSLPDTSTSAGLAGQLPEHGAAPWLASGLATALIVAMLLAARRRWADA